MGKPEKLKPAGRVTVVGIQKGADVINYKAAGRPNRGLRAGSRNSPGWSGVAIVYSRRLSMRYRCCGVLPLARWTAT